MSDFEYLRHRLEEEDEKAKRMVGTEAELIHRSLAAIYAKRALVALERSAGNDEGDAFKHSL
ncbi:hypothetical protein LWE61_11855 [Sphingobium sufflavum]|uniref:hypothetical protein n=1 Tax=Sphingobium sufflavum TaxID=1129547 RepID=UPI001F2CEC95|nr:hypothetical protein [Sphingobium sufflavum]MCE7797252.1 hypothetical protein [Sphingobium sufflavum]